MRAKGSTFETGSSATPHFSNYAKNITEWKSMQKTKQKSIQTCFRLEPTTHQRLHAMAQEAGISSREWLERAIIENETKIIVKQKPHPDLSTLIYHVNKAGNNLNQLAHVFNSLKKTNEITRDEFVLSLNALESMSLDFKEAIRYACKKGNLS